MSDDKQDKRAWRIIEATTRGAAHVRADLDSQDAIRSKQKPDSGVPLVLAVSDGHGSKKYFRSGQGAKFAVQSAVDMLPRFEQFSRDKSFSDIEDRAKHLPIDIMSRWRELVKQDWQQCPPDDQAWQWLLQNAETRNALSTNLTVPYGATLLAVLVTERFILYLQLGDGDILAVSVAGEVDEPMPEDPRHVANETTSLCSPTAEHDFRVICKRLEDPQPALILLSTDGYVNSFADKTGFHEVGKHIWQMIHSERIQGIEKIENELEGWLRSVSKQGSGDDITVGIVCRMSAIDEEIVVPVHENDGIVTEDASTSSASSTEPSQNSTTIEDLEEDDAASQLSVSSPRILTVSQKKQDGPDCFSTIAEAIKQAQPGTEIRVKPGQYQERLIIDKDVEIIGDGPPEDIIIKHNAPCLQMRAKHARVEGLTFEGKGEPDKNRGAVELEQGQSIMCNCIITSQTKYCVTINGEACDPTIDHCQIQKGKGYGIIIDNHGKGVIDYCKITGNALAGIGIARGSEPLIRNCEISRNKQKGVDIYQGGGIFQECSIGQHEVAVSIRGGDKVHLQKCKVYRADTGIWIDEKSEVWLIDHTRIFSNNTGIKIIDDSLVVLQECSIDKDNKLGIEIKGRRASVKDCQVEDNARYRIRAESNSGALFEKHQPNGNQTNPMSTEEDAHTADKAAIDPQLTKKEG